MPSQSHIAKQSLILSISLGVRLHDQMLSTAGSNFSVPSLSYPSLKRG